MVLTAVQPFPYTEIKMKIIFSKYHHNGNDFIIFDTIKNPDLTYAQAKEWSKKHCIRKYGVGADNALYLACTHDSIFMHIFNITDIDGDMCGNGSLCVAKYLHDTMDLCDAILSTKSRAIVTHKLDNGYTASIGHVKPCPGLGHKYSGVLKQILKNHAGNQDYYIVHAGEPHLVVPVNDSSIVDLKKLGDAIHSQAIFPMGINVDIMHKVDDATIAARFYERSCFDETQACGTGSACCAHVADLKGPITIKHKNGTTSVAHDNTGYQLIGNPVKIYDGVYDG